MRERTAIRRNKTANVWTPQSKVLTFLDDKRVWHKDGTSSPIFNKEIYEIRGNVNAN
jgi:hypothetical protein